MARRLGTTRIVGAALAASLLVIGASACTSVVDGAALAADTDGPTTSKVAVADITAETLPSLLLSADELSELIDIPNMTAGETFTAPDVTTTPFQPPGCVGAVFSGMDRAYESSGYQAIYSTRTVDNFNETKVDQAVALFASPADAQRALDDYLAMVRGCVGTVTVDAGTTTTYTVSGPADAGDGITTWTADTEYTKLDRALAVRGTVLVDSQVIHPEDRKHAEQLTKALLERIDTTG